MEHSQHALKQVLFLVTATATAKTVQAGAAVGIVGRCYHRSVSTGKCICHRASVSGYSVWPNSAQFAMCVSALRLLRRLFVSDQYDY